MSSLTQGLNYRSACDYTLRLKKLCKVCKHTFLSELYKISTDCGNFLAQSFTEVYSFSTPPNLCQRTTVLNTDVPYCYVML